VKNLSNPISKTDYNKLQEMAEELKQMREKYNLKEINIKTEKWCNDESLNISVRAENPYDYYSNFLIFKNHKYENSYEEFLKRV